MLRTLSLARRAGVLVLAAVIAAPVLTPRPLVAQDAAAVVASPDVKPSADASASASPAPRSIMYENQTAAAHRTVARDSSAATATTALAANAHVGAGQNIALMIVGVAGIVAGIAIGGGGGTAVAVAGAAVGLYGLYQFVK